TLARQVAAPWPVVLVRVRPSRRLGVVVHTLEIDVGDELVVFGRRELGAAPADVAEVLDALRDAG
nr:PH domain-containing protein [Geodermatophilaceae bacterium]